MLYIFIRVDQFMASSTEYADPTVGYSSKKLCATEIFLILEIDSRFLPNMPSRHHVVIHKIPC